MQILPGITGAAAPAAAGAQTTGSASGTGGSSAGAATVTANDFLQLLVAEMKNQDPTANTDPNQYINQLVQVNSLEQLVQINQDLGGGAASGTGASGQTAGNSGVAVHRPAFAVSGGNLSVGDPGSTASAATRVASSLGAVAHPAPAAAADGTTGNRFDTIVAAMRRSAPAVSTTTNPAR